MLSSKAHLEYSVECFCPYCAKRINLIEEEQDGELSKFIFTNQWEVISGKIITCPVCDTEFQLESLEY